MFRKNWLYDPSKQNKEETLQNIHDCLGMLQSEIDKGRIRAFGLSNESAWGTARSGCVDLKKDTDPAQYRSKMNIL